jgi:predicted RNA-binding Zn ribbon-like protein
VSTAADERARLVTAVLTECGVRPALRAAEDRIRPAWLVPRKRDALLAAAAVTLYAQLEQHDHERLGVCASTNCGDVYVDASPRAHRRYCSVTCSNRERVAAFRRRAS